MIFDMYENFVIVSRLTKPMENEEVLARHWHLGTTAMLISIALQVIFMAHAFGAAPSKMGHISIIVQNLPRGISISL